MSKASHFHRLKCSAALFFSLLLPWNLSGCTGKAFPALQEPPELASAFTAQIAFSVSDLSGTALLTKTAENTLRLDFQTPETLNGYTAAIDENGVALSFGSVTVSLGDSLPDGALITVLENALTLSAQPEEVQTAFQDGFWQFSGTLPKASGGFLLTVSSDGIPMELIAERAGISVVFSQTETSS